MEIPVLDLSDFLSRNQDSKKVFIKKLGDAFRQAGCALIENHNLNNDLVQRAHQDTERVFSLETCSTHTGDSRGYQHKNGVEVWSVGREELANGQPQNLYPQNVWPDDWPTEFKDDFLKLYRQLENNCRPILEAAALYVHRPNFYFCNMITNGNSTLDLSHVAPGENQSECQPDFISLHFDTEEALEVADLNGNWQHLKLKENQVLVRVGEMLQNLTNGFYRQTNYRFAQGSKPKHRLFMPFSVLPKSTTDLTPLPECVKLTGGRLKFPSINSEGYLQARTKKVEVNEEAQRVAT